MAADPQDTSSSTDGRPGPREESDATTQADAGLAGGTGATEDGATEEPYGTEGGPEEDADGLDANDSGL